MRLGRRWVLLAAASLTLAGCAGDEPQTIKKAARGARPGGNLTVGITPPGSIEPSNAFEPMGQLVVRTMCDPLIDVDPVTGELKPAIAESWQIHSDGRRITLKLRKDVRFHNGEEVQADDVAFALSRVADREYASAVAELLRPIAGFDEIHGEIDTDNEELLERLAGVRPTEEYGLEIGLKEPNADFLRALTHPLASPIPKEEVLEDPDAFERKPVCAGPYRLAEPWDPSKQSIKLERFRDYYGLNLAFTRGGRGYPDTIEFRVDRDPDSALAAQQAGNSDLVRVPAARIAENRPDPGFFQAPSATLEYLGLPVTTDAFANSAVRVALSQAVNRQALVDAVFAGGRVPATGILPPAAGDVFREGACAELVPPTGSVDSATALLNEEGIQLGGTTMRLYFNDEFNNRKVVENVAAQWKAALGMNSELVAVGWDEYITRATGQGGFDGPFRMSRAAPYASPDQYLFPLFHSDSIGQENFTRFASPTFDRLLERSARRAETLEDLKVEYRRLEQVACSRMPIVPLTFGSQEYVASARTASAVETFADRTSGQPAIRELYVRAS
ncbi:MAG: ABC transporter substrate-binding protein [Actinomycetota bacterium]